LEGIIIESQTQDIIIIGAGIAGLTTGCYARMNGYSTKIFEMHDNPGGMCTAWKRKGYTFDGCMHNVVGTGTASKVRRIWDELGALQSGPAIDFQEFVRIESEKGQALTVYTNIDDLEKHLRELSPQDFGVITEYCQAARRFAKLDILALPAVKPWELIKVLPYLRLLKKWMSITLQDFGKRFKDPFLRQAFPSIQYDIPEVPAGISLAFLGGMHNRDLGWFRGGSIPFSQAIAKRFLDLGGEIYYQSKVTKVLVENDRAVGVRLADGTEYRADRIISAADGRATIFDMLEGKYINERIQQYYNNLPSHIPMNLQISLGVNLDLAKEPHAIVLILNQPVLIAGEERARLDMELYGFDPSLAPPGKTVLKVMLDSSFAYWKKLYDEGEPYTAEKDRVAAQVIELLEKRFPSIRAHIEVIDVATPVTTERYTGNWQGLQAYMPLGNGLGAMFKGFTTTLPGLENFYMVGQWAGATIGISTVAIMGRKLIQRICKRDRRRFITNKLGAGSDR
jgi:phytoene dehydrogenase-like protein